MLVVVRPGLSEGVDRALHQDDCPRLRRGCKAGLGRTRLRAFRRDFAVVTGVHREHFPSSRRTLYSTPETRCRERVDTQPLPSCAGRTQRTWLTDTQSLAVPGASRT